MNDIKKHNFEFKVIKGRGEVTLNSYRIGEKVKDSITITFTDIESFKITSS